MRQPPYPTYKPSGVDWLGMVPAHWELTRLKMFAPLTDTKVEANEEQPVPYIGMENVESWTANLSFTGDVVPTGTANEFKAGHTLFGKLRPYLAKACNPDFDGLCSTEFLVLKCIGANSRAFLYSLLTGGFVKLVDSSAYGSKMPRASWNFVGNCILPVAPAPEQHAIANFLDGETAKIDTLVARKRTLVERLKEKRAALISRTVTRGLPPDAARLAGLPPYPKLKPSGIDWLGDVPQDWKIVRIGREITLQRGVDITKDEQQEGEVPVVSSGGISSFHDLALTAAPGVVVGRKGTAGAVHYITVDFWPHDTTLYVKDFCGNHPRYVYFKLMSMELASFDTGSANPTVNRNLVHPVVVSWPPVPEQGAIADFLDRESAKLDLLTAKIETAIERLQEYRAALVTAAVTGKIDVRGAVAHQEDAA